MPHPLDQHNVQKALDTVAQLLPKHEQLANDVAKNPHDDGKKGELQATTDNIKDELDNLRQALRGLLSSGVIQTWKITPFFRKPYTCHFKGCC